MTPEYLFRTYSDESTGLNSPTLFKPFIYTSGTTTDIKDVVSNPAKMAICLEKGLKWNDDNIDTPFINWTDSFLFALLFALFKQHPKSGNPRRSQEHNIHIICLKTSTAIDAHNSPAVFTKTSELMKTYGVSLRNTYDNEFATIDSVHPGAGSFVVSLKDLLAAGLYELHPALHVAFQRPDPRWRLTLFDFRRFWFTSEVLFTWHHIGLAARLADTAVAINGDDAYPLPFLAALLSLNKRERNDKQLSKWLGRSEKVNTMQANKAMDALHDEVHQFCDILHTLKRFQITRAAHPTNIGATAVSNNEGEAWKAFQLARKAERREGFADRETNGRLPRRSRAERVIYRRNRSDSTTGAIEHARRTMTLDRDDKSSRRGRDQGSRRAGKVQHRRRR